MEVKNAAAICLISLFSATLVVLIARALDQQAAARLEPQLKLIVEELHALRTQGGLAVAPGATAPSKAADNGLVVYYFHGNTRCPTCEAIESQAHEAVQSYFGAQLQRGDMAWKVLNYEQPASADLTRKFSLQVPVVVLARMKGGEVAAWKRLDDVWALVDDKPAFLQYVRSEIDKILAVPGDAAAGEPEQAGKPSAPAAAPPADLPIPK